jgi:hypothetical protein
MSLIVTGNRKAVVWTIAGAFAFERIALRFSAPRLSKFFLPNADNVPLLLWHLNKNFWLMTA